MSTVPGPGSVVAGLRRSVSGRRRHPV